MQFPAEGSLVAPLDRAYSSTVTGEYSFQARQGLSVSNIFGTAVELRKSRRYRLQAPVSFLWERPDGQLQEGKGTIRDISDRGVFVTGDMVPERGAHLDVDVYLPSLEFGGAAVKLHGEGTVIRVYRGEGVAKGFVAAVAFHTEAASGPTLVSPRRLH